MMTPQTPHDEPTLSDTSFDALLQLIRGGHSADNQTRLLESRHRKIAQAFQLARTTLRSASRTEKSVSAQRDALMAEIRRGNHGTTSTTSATTRTGIARLNTNATPRRWIMGVALGAAAIVGSVVGLSRFMGADGLAVTRDYTTTAGQLATITLGDGSRVTLAPRTTLRLVHFGQRQRKVVLDGEAYFEVGHAAGAPFLVQSGGVTTRVLGTAFLVRHYSDDRTVRVAVADGKVSLTGKSMLAEGVPLTAGSVGDIGDSTINVSSVNDLTPQTDWMRGKLMFHNAPVPDVLTALSHWYGIHFNCTDSAVVQQRITAGLSTQSSSAALATLEQVLEVDITVVGDTVTLVPYARHPARTIPRMRRDEMVNPTREVGR